MLSETALIVIGVCAAVVALVLIIAQLKLFTIDEKLGDIVRLLKRIEKELTSLKEPSRKDDK